MDKNEQDLRDRIIRLKLINFLKWFGIAFPVIMVLNQLGYGACFAPYCLAAAFSKVLIFSTLVGVVAHYVTWVDKKVDEK